MTDIKNELITKNEISWCPGCSNFAIIESVKRAIANLVRRGFKKENFVMVTGIGCHAKIFDYLNIGGIYGLHGRVLPTAMGIKLGNPNLTVLGFAGDGGTYAEGMGHFIHAFRYNTNLTFIVFNNQAFSLTTGQATPTSKKGHKSKADPLGEQNVPINPIKLALAAGATFVARCNPLDMQFTSEIIEKAIKHKGFSYIDMLQKCPIFGPDYKNIFQLMYKIPDNDDVEKALQFASEWDYSSEQGKIALGIIYQTIEQTFEDKWSQLRSLKEKGVGWAKLKK